MTYEKFITLVVTFALCTSTIAATQVSARSDAAAQAQAGHRVGQDPQGHWLAGAASLFAPNKKTQRYASIAVAPAVKVTPLP